VTRLEIVAFADEHLDEAARLLADRQARHRTAETVRDLYATAAARWVEEGRSRHSVLVPASDAELLDAWWRLCFGKRHPPSLRVTDWRVTNQLSFRFWPKRGFRTSFLRLYRSIP
jgi:hypothetical protein